MEKYKIELERKDMDTLHGYLKNRTKELERLCRNYEWAKKEQPLVFDILKTQTEDTIRIFEDVIEQIEKGFGMK